MKIPVVLVLFALLIFYFIIPVLIWRFARNSKTGKVLTILFLLVFLVVLFYGITGKIAITSRYATINMDFTNVWCGKKINFNLSNIDKTDFIINIFMLIPVGLVVAYFVRKSFVCKLFVFLLVGFMCGIILETTQFILPVYRSVQLSDVVLNTISVVLGGLMGVLYDVVFAKIIRKE